MFMFTFAIIAISIIGLFFQVSMALALFFSLQQVGLGQQMISWHAMAYDYACSAAGLGLPVGTPAASDIKLMRPTIAGSTTSVYTGVNWPTVIFNGNFVDQAGVVSPTATRFVMTYTDPSKTYGGVPAGEVGRQMKVIALKSNMFPGTITTNNGVITTNISVYANGGGKLTAKVINLPAGVPTGGNALVTIANCL